ncbi:MAG TPA: toluene-4-monooxygenase system B family protein [Polyangia bacterium]|nr:toluene-4-monooxygenase system B family protein [Polyangia bacterium]
MIPLYGFLQGDSMGLLIMAREDDTLGRLAEKLQSAADVRVAPLKRPRVMVAGRLLDLEMTVAAAGLTALDKFEVGGTR